MGTWGLIPRVQGLVLRFMVLGFGGWGLRCILGIGLQVLGVEWTSMRFAGMQRKIEAAESWLGLT